MEYIHPQNRYSQSATCLNIDKSLIISILKEIGTTNEEFEILSGGYKNSNILYELNGHKRVLRIYASGFDTAAREHALLTFLKDKSKVPSVYEMGQYSSSAYLVHEYIDGITLENYLLSNREIPESLFYDLGKELAVFHSIEYEDNGILNQELKVSQSFGDVNKYIYHFMLKTLKNISNDRLAHNIRDRLIKLITDKWHIVESNYFTNRLTHFDFNPKNIMVTPQGGLQSILDWEFSMSANALADLGNFFRFEYDYPKFARRSFIEGYSANNTHFPENWYDAALLLDLGAMCGFLERKENYTKTFQTARQLIKNTLNYFKY